MNGWLAILFLSDFAPSAFEESCDLLFLSYVPPLAETYGQNALSLAHSSTTGGLRRCS